MNINFSRLRCIFISIMLTFFATQTKAQTDSTSQTDSIAFAAADTSRFSPNIDEGWQLFNSYVTNLQNDSARLELIIQHTNNINWTVDQYVGVISDSSLIPSEEQDVPFSLLTNNYNLRIDTAGKCYIRFVNGDLPTDDPFVIPLKLIYKL